MNLIGHRGQDQSAGLIRSDYINHILHGTDVLRKIAKMPKWQPLCFIIYVMTINLVNHKNFGGWTWRLIDFWDFHLSRCHGDNPKDATFFLNHGSKIIVVNYFQWWLNNEQVCKFTLCNNAKETTLEKLSATHQPLESFMKAQPFLQTSHFIETIELFLLHCFCLLGVSFDWSILSNRHFNRGLPRFNHILEIINTLS